MEATKNFFGSLFVVVGVIMIPVGIGMALAQHDGTVWIAGIGTLLAGIGAAMLGD